MRSYQGDASLWHPILLRAEEGVGSTLYRLLPPSYAGSLIPAERFFVKKKSSLLHVGYFLCRAGISEQGSVRCRNPLKSYNGWIEWLSLTMKKRYVHYKHNNFLL